MKNKKLITPLRRRLITWITPCKRSAARSKVNAHSPGNPVGVQPTTGLVKRVHYIPRAASLSGVARGYPSLSPTDFNLYSTSLKDCKSARAGSKKGYEDIGRLYIGAY